MVDMSVHSVEGEKIGEIKLKEDMFNAKINKHIVHQIVKRYLAEKRRGTASVKGRSDVSGGGKKPWKQKGTGRARAGTTRSPLWTGGGVVFGPENRDYGYTIPRKMRLVALKSVLSDKVKNDNLIVLDKIEIENGKTRDITNIFDKLKIEPEKKIIIVIEKDDEKIKRAVNNLQNAMVITANKLNTYDLVNYQKMLVTKDALKIIEEVFV
ncbi:MAG: 50S ribosomal protein L4 [Candidatus Caldatribacteriota bacterium]|jgi:large subunit ribosomal protein L4|nr:50S ribosomal protein L4 [Atribacterota bacterium]MDD3031579.1 50S ribosomal protein L4 [Atribacterota bacterium]MDD4288502.1 50S ribosomal protein L4 [Atribacterota bacterium]MDI9596862.1 50S ribosomal protein L4 [Atribacterota bacterium]